MQIRKGNITIMVSDFDRAVTFYTETLGMKLESRYVAFPKGVKDEGAVKLAFFADPDGCPLDLCQVMHGATA